MSGCVYRCRQLVVGRSAYGLLHDQLLVESILLLLGWGLYWR